MFSNRHKLWILTAVLLLGAATRFASPQQDAAHPAIQYEKTVGTDVVQQLMNRLASGQTKLTYDKQFGWLPAVMKALDLKRESQILTFGKTSFQARLISPQRPRALYFNEQVSIGYIPHSDLMELAAVDARQGTIFYTLVQDPTAPRIQRDNSCLQCHENPATQRVPGLFIRSVYPEPDGQPIFRAGGFISDHRSPLTERWGGWYVTGQHGQQRHMGNAFARDEKSPETLDSQYAFNLASLEKRFNTADYLTPYSDIVALMVIEHQTRVTNLITRAGWDTRRALYDRDVMVEALGELTTTTAASTQRRIKSACEPLVEALLLSGETELTEPLRGKAGFAESFAKLGPFDGQGRSLRQLDMTKRMFRYPCSFLIYSAAFDALPPEMLDCVYRQLWEVLSGKDTSPRFAHLSAADRQAIKEILLATKKSLPSYWATPPGAR
jgi:hypothetical protein